MVGAHGDYTFLEMTNSGAACSLFGYPAVSIYDGTGVLIGGPAPPRPGASPQKVVLQPGGKAEFEIYDTIGSAPNCQANWSGRTLWTYPPGQSAPIIIAYGYPACGLSVTSIHLPTPHPVTQ